MSSFLLAALMTLILAAAAAQDAATRRISNIWPLAVLALAGAKLILAPQAMAWSDALAPLAIFAIGLGLWRLGALGGGDVKLIAAVCLFLGMPRLLPFLAYLCLAGGLVALSILAWNSVRGGGSRIARIPYAPAVLAGWLASLILAVPALD